MQQSLGFCLACQETNIKDRTHKAGELEWIADVKRLKFITNLDIKTEVVYTSMFSFQILSATLSLIWHI